ncbi:MAG: hypothetical protein IT357_17035 [Gemmatimonadaceae bacterium]|nr:hypothetical protein [Gemmatimonadaceae bacterium]
MISALLVLALQGSAAQVTARVTPEQVAVGEPITIELRVRAPLGTEIRFPALPDSNDVVEPLDPRQLREASSATIIDRTAVYRLIAWDTGQRVVRFGDITLTRDGATRRYPVTLPALQIRSVLPADTALRKPRPSRAVQDVPPPWWKYAIGAVVVLAILWLLRKALRSRARAKDRGPDPAKIAEEAVAHAAKLGLLEAGETGRHALSHVDVMRRYLAARFPQADLTRTAREVSDALVGAEFPILPARVSELLLRTEPVAFARAAVRPDEARAIAEEAKAIVRAVETAWRARQEQAGKRKPRKRA